MPTLDELLHAHQAAQLAYSKLFAASQAISKRLQAVLKERTALRQQIAPLVGPISQGQLVQTLNGSRFYEIQSGAPDSGYHAAVVYKRTGSISIAKIGVSASVQYTPTRYLHYLQRGSVRPVPLDHPVYLKWQKYKFRQKLEGQE